MLCDYCGEIVGTAVSCHQVSTALGAIPGGQYSWGLLVHTLHNITSRIMWCHTQARRVPS